MKILRENYLSFHSSCYSSLKDNKKLEMQVWGFKREIQASSILNGLHVKGWKWTICKLDIIAKGKYKTIKGPISWAGECLLLASEETNLGRIPSVIHVARGTALLCHGIQKGSFKKEQQLPFWIPWQNLQRRKMGIENKLFYLIAEESPREMLQ